MLTFLIISTSLSSKDFFIHQVVSFFFCCRKKLDGEGIEGGSAITFLVFLSFSGKSPVCQDEYSKHVCSVKIKMGQK